MNWPPPDFDASARGMIKNFGAKAAREAEQRAAHYAEKSDAEAGDTWLAIAAAIKTLESQAQAPVALPARQDEALIAARDGDTDETPSGQRLTG